VSPATHLSPKVIVLGEGKIHPSAEKLSSHDEPGTVRINICTPVQEISSDLVATDDDDILSPEVDID
jgi:hypothetical protein